MKVNLKLAYTWAKNREYNTPLHEESSQHGHMGDPRVIVRTCGTINEMAQVILLCVKTPNIGNAFNPRTLYEYKVYEYKNHEL